MDESFLENGFRLSEVAQLEVRGWVFGDLLPET
jgi:hypothetical protein